DDPRFYLLAIKNRIVHHLVALYSGAALPLEYVERVDISGQAEVEFDGDACGQLPITITAATPLEVMLPEPEAD
ncbi:MAG: hypothetical protein LBQ81_12050, partial [Zoogloeaceae bacterium]|nr:hypothetical protein [Zoogloeaceae bacterium]